MVRLQCRVRSSFSPSLLHASLAIKMADHQSSLSSNLQVHLA